MSANPLTLPPARHYNGDDTWIKFASNLIDAEPLANITLLISGSGPLIGEEVTIEWASLTVTFTVATNVNATATAWPIKSGLETLAEYAQRVAEAIRQNGAITAAWHVQYLGLAGAAEQIKLVYRDRVAIPIAATSTLTNVVVNDIDGVNPLMEPNLACMVQVWQAAPDPNDDTLLGTLQSPYELVEGVTSFNLKNYFNLSPTLPTKSSISPGLITSWPRGIAAKSFAEYYLRYNDKHGTPATPLALIKSPDNYFALHGSRSVDHDDVITSGIIEPLHRYRRRDGGVYRKAITHQMPDWVYLWNPAEVTDCNVKFILYWSDGTEETDVYAGTAFSFLENTAYWVKSTPKNLAAYPPPSPGAFIEYITFQLEGDPGTGVVTLMEVYYQVKPTPDFQRWLIFDNGLGGCETVLMHGKSRQSINVSRDIARRQRGSDFSEEMGELDTISADAQRSIEMSTGWVERYYIEHLQQLLLGDVWLIDTQQISASQLSGRFIKLICDTSSVAVHADDATLFSMELQFKPAFYDTAINI